MKRFSITEKGKEKYRVEGTGSIEGFWKEGEMPDVWKQAIKDKLVVEKDISDELKEREEEASLASDLNDLVLAELSGDKELADSLKKKHDKAIKRALKRKKEKMKRKKRKK